MDFKNWLFLSEYYEKVFFQSGEWEKGYIFSNPTPKDLNNMIDLDGLRLYKDGGEKIISLRGILDNKDTIWVWDMYMTDNSTHKRIAAHLGTNIVVDFYLSKYISLVTPHPSQPNTWMRYYGHSGSEFEVLSSEALEKDYELKPYKNGEFVCIRKNWIYEYSGTNTQMTNDEEVLDRNYNFQVMMGKAPPLEKSIDPSNFLRDNELWLKNKQSKANEPLTTLTPDMLPPLKQRLASITKKHVQEPPRYPKWQ